MSDTPLADQLARISRDEFDRYIQDFRPTEQKVINSLDQSTVGQAMDSAQADAVRSRAALDRMRQRYGVEVSPTQAAAESRQRALSGALGVISAGNAAQRADEDNRRQTLAGVLNVGQGIRQQALGNFSSASQLEGSRTAANRANEYARKQQKEAEKQQTIGTVAALATTAAFAF